MSSFFQFFKFEADFVNSLHCIPMQVRYKLDTCGVKLKLHHWNQMSQTERQTLIDHPCTTPADIEAYRSMLQSLVMQYNSEPAPTLPIDPSPAWLNEQAIPTEIQIKAQELGLTIDTSRWSNLTPLQRYALIKLSRPSHENRNFLPALQEFDLVAP